MKPQANKTKAEQICTYLLDEIASGRTKPGDRLLSERDLSAKLGVSRMPLREALRALCNMGVLLTKRGGGTYVTKSAKKNPIEFPIFDMSKIAIFEVLHARTIIESEAARLAAIEATADEIAYICTCKDMREAEIKKQLSSESDENDTIHTLDTNFHMAIVQASHNTIFINFLESIIATLAIHQRQASFNPDMFGRSSLCHQKIYDAIVRRDPINASKMMKEHIEDIGDALKHVHSMAKKDRQ